MGGLDGDIGIPPPSLLYPGISSIMCSCHNVLDHYGAKAAAK